MGVLILQRKIESLRSGKLVEFISDILDRHKSVLVELQKDQLYAGQNAKGKKLAPSYLNDPFFKSKESAQRYSDFKARINPRAHNSIFATKDKDTPNLIITGGLIYDTIFANVTDKSLIIDARSSIISIIEQKYTEPFGLNQTAWDFFTEKYLMKELKQEIANYLKQ